MKHRIHFHKEDKVKFIEYNPVDEKGSCVIRTFTKLLDKDFYVVKEELLKLAHDLNCDDYREQIVFEKYKKSYRNFTFT